MASEKQDGAGPRGPLPIEAFTEAARELDVEGFEARHGDGFLILTTTGFGAPADSYSTQMYLEGIDESGCPNTAGMQLLVFPIISDIHIVTLGRAPNNNIVIPDPSVSRLHALVKRNDDGVFMLLDAGSTNGSSVNGTAIAVRGRGAPTALKVRDKVCIGQVEFTFADARELRDFVQLKIS